MDFIDLEKAHDRVDREGLWQVLRIYDVVGKHLSGIKNLYVDSSASESERFWTDSGVR